SRTTLAADRVDFIDENDARSVLLRVLEHVAYASRAYTDEHLDKIRTGDREERHLGLAGDRLGEQGFAGSRGADHQDPAWDTPAHLLELARITKKFDQFLYFFLRLVATRHVGESYVVVALIEHACARLAKRERSTAATTLHLAHEEDPDANEEQHREPRNE